MSKLQLYNTELQKRIRVYRVVSWLPLTLLAFLWCLNAIPVAVSIVSNPMVRYSPSTAGSV